MNRIFTKATTRLRVKGRGYPSPRSRRGCALSQLGFHVGLAVTMLATGSMQAKQLSLTEAFNYAEVSNSAEATKMTPAALVGKMTRSMPQLLYTQTEGALNVAYVISNSIDNGYVVLAADDVLPAILGYSDSGSFDVANMPPALKGWLEEYGRQLAFAVQNASDKTTRASERVAKAAIAPLCAAKWNQSQPFNDLAPEINGKKAPTGCTATAMAQVAYVHKWPKQGTGENTYISGYNRQPLTFDFGATTFDWDNMLPSYNSNYTAQQADAVATLMAACGNASLMTYNDEASGAYPYDAIYGMVKFMGYDKSAVMLERDYFNSALWDDLIYEELSAGRPVIYGGYNSSYKNGHTFIVDGYNDGFYHLNWGWGGLSDGYFLLTALDPSEQGIGGSASGYNFRQDAIVNVMPAKEDSGYALQVMWDGPFTVVNKAYTAKGTAEFTVGRDGTYRAFTLEDTKANMGLRLTPTDGGESIFCPGSQVEFLSYYGLYQAEAYQNFQVEVPTLPTEGTYIVTPACEHDGIVSDVAVKVGEMNSLIMTCSKMGVKFEDVAVERTLTADNIKIIKSLYSGKTCTVTAEIHNSGEEYLGVVRGAFLDSEGTILCWLPGVPVNIVDNGTANVTFSGTLNSYNGALPAGEYIFDVVDEAGQSICPNPLNVTVLEAPSGKPVYSSEFDVTGNVSGEGTKVSPYLVGDHTDFRVEISVTSGLFDEVIAIYAYYDDEFVGGNNKDADFTSSTESYRNFFVAPGETEEYTFNLGTSEFELGKTVYIQAYGWKPDWSGEGSGWMSRKIYVKRTSGAVAEIVNGNEGVYPNPAQSVSTVTCSSAINWVKVYSITGCLMLSSDYSGDEGAVELNVSGLSSGQYIVVVNTADGLKRYRLIKR